MISHIVHVLWGLDFDGLTAKLRSISEFVTFVIAACSALANVMPRVERVANDRLRAAARVTRKIVNAGALNINVRSLRTPPTQEEKRDDAQP